MDFSRDKTRTIIERSSLSMPKAVVVAAAVGCAFGLGVVSARAAGPDDRQGIVADDRALEGDALARADARTKAYEARIKAATSTWHAEITAPEVIEVVALPTKTKPAVTAVVAAVEAVAANEAPSSSPTVDTDVVRAADLEPAEAKKPDAEPAARAKNEDRDEDEGDVVTAPKPEQLAAALSKVLGQKAASTAAVDDRRYAVQLASTPKKDAASSIAAGFVQKGFAAKVVVAEVPGKGTMYRVRVNGFATRAAADGVKARIGQGLVVTED